MLFSVLFFGVLFVYHTLFLSAFSIFWLRLSIFTYVLIFFFSFTSYSLTLLVFKFSDLFPIVFKLHVNEISSIFQLHFTLLYVCFLNSLLFYLFCASMNIILKEKYKNGSISCCYFISLRHIWLYCIAWPGGGGVGVWGGQKVSFIFKNLHQQ
jgi:hypothetical protein